MTIDPFLIFEQYNQAIWPLQIVTCILGIIAVFFIFKKTKYSLKIIFMILSFFWLWTGIIFCFKYWGVSFKIAYFFGILCVLQGLLFFYNLFKPDMADFPQNKLHIRIGSLFVIYAIIGYPVFGYLLGHVYPKLQPFGLVPCPTAVFTFGLFLLINKKFPRYFLIVPIIVTIAGGTAIFFGVYEDIGLLLAGITGTYLILQRDKIVGQT